MIGFSKFLSGNVAYLASRTFAPKSDPLTLDLDGDGLETVGITPNAPIPFDRNGNGSIDNGSELFGDSTALYAGAGQTFAADGFAALAQEDTNGDGLVNAADAHWSSLRVWRDLNQDGISQTGELFTLASQEIAALKVAKTANSQLLANGNQIADLGGYIRTDGSERALGEVTGLGDVNLASNPFYSEFTDHIPLTEAAQGIAGMQGAGMVRELQEAASLDGTLATQVAALATPISRTQMLAQIDGIVARWAETSAMSTSIEEAEDKGYLLKYLAPGMSTADILMVLGLDLGVAGGGGGGGGGEMISPAEASRREALRAQMDHISELIGILERFNGTPFVTVGDTSVTTGTGIELATNEPAQDAPALEPSPYVFVPISAGQFDLLNQSDAALKQSIYDGLAVERLKLHPDRAANDQSWRMVA